MLPGFRKLTEELRLADESLKKDPTIDGVALRDLRQALDSLRFTAWAIDEVQSAKETGQDLNKMVSFLRAERLRRFGQAIDALCADLDRDGTQWPPTTIHDLQESVSLLRERLGLITIRRRTVVKN